MKLSFISAILTLMLFVVLFAEAPGDTATTGQTGTATLTSGVRPLPFKPGDALEIITYPDTGAFPTGFYPIDGEGFVDFPIIGYIKVTNMSSDALAKLLAEKYVDFMRYPHMKVRPVIRIALNGGFYRPGLYWINPHASLWEAIQMAGGPQRPDGFKKLKWERNNEVFKQNLAPVIQEGKSLYQIGFTTGDQLTVIQQPQRTGWELFKTEILPMLTFSITTAVSIFTVYSSMLMYQNYSNR